MVLEDTRGEGSTRVPGKVIGGGDRPSSGTGKGFDCQPTRYFTLPVHKGPLVFILSTFLFVSPSHV